MREISDRHFEVFRLIVERHIETAAPVGSSYLARTSGLGISPATIRNAMMDLEEMGLVRQPFTSAGRIPTDAGYRHYINVQLRKEPLTAEERGTIDNSLRFEGSDLHRSVETAGRVLGSLSKQLGIVIGPALRGSVLKRLELVALAPARLLVVLSVDSGVIRTLLLSLSLEIEDSDLVQVSRLLNERLCGLTLAEIRRTYMERTRLTPGFGLQKRRAIIDSMRPVFDEELEDIYLGGTSNIVAQPEFSSSDRLQGIFSLIERRKPLVDLLRHICAGGGVNVSVGAENPYDEMKDCALVAFSYSVGGSCGLVGILGPTRMPYWKVISLVEYVGNRLSSIT